MTRSFAAFAVVLLVLGACAATPSAVLPIASGTPLPASTPAPIPSPTLTPTQPPTNPPTASPTASPAPATPKSAPPSPSPVATSTPVSSTFPEGSVIVTFKVLDEQFRVLLIDPANIAIAQKLLAGKEAPTIPNGVVVRGDPSVNAPWSWHIDPDTLEFADMTTEVCDGKPSFVEADEITGDHFCPWSAKVIDIEPAN